MEEPKRWKRPNIKQSLSMVVLIACALSPIFALIYVHWVLALFAAFCFWPSMVVVTRLVLKDKDWPVIVGGPGISKRRPYRPQNY